MGVGLGVTGYLNFVTTKGAELLGITQQQLHSAEHYINLQDFLFISDKKVGFEQLMSTLQETGDNSTLVKLRSGEFVWAEVVQASALIINMIERSEAAVKRNGLKYTSIEISTDSMKSLLNDEKLSPEADAEFAGLYIGNSGYSHNSMTIDIRELEGFTAVKRVDTGLGLGNDDDTEDENDEILFSSEKNRKRHDSISSNADAYDQQIKVEFEGMSMFREVNAEEADTNDGIYRANRSHSDTQSSTHTSDTTTTDSANSSDSNRINVFRTTPMNCFDHVRIKDDNSVLSGTADTEYWSGSGSDDSNKLGGTDRDGSAQHTDTEEEMNFEDVFEEYEKDPINFSDSLKRIRISSQNGVSISLQQGRSQSPESEFSKRIQRPLKNRQTEPLMSGIDDKEDDGGWFIGSI